MDDTPKMGRAGSAAFLAFLLLLAFGAVWVIEQDFEGPSANTKPAPQAAALEPPAETPATNIDDAISPDLASRSVDLPVAEDQPDTEPDEPEASPLPGRNAPASVGTGLQTRPETGARTRPPLANQPAGQRDRLPAVERTSPANRIPFPASPPLSQQYMRTPATEPAAPPSPEPPRVAAAEPSRVAPVEPAPATLPRVAVEEPVLRPPVTPPSEPPPPPAATTPAPAPPTTTPASPAVSRPAPAAAPSTAARVTTGDVDNNAIRDVLGRYRTAYNSLDAKAAHQVWPSVNERTLDRAFGQLQEQNVSFDRCTIAVKGVIAEANCNGTTRFVPRVGSRSEQVESRQWNFSLRKAYSGGWVIQNVDTR